MTIDDQRDFTELSNQSVESRFCSLVPAARYCSTYAHFCLVSFSSFCSPAFIIHSPPTLPLATLLAALTVGVNFGSLLSVSNSCRGFSPYLVIESTV
jgi:hypothetical protein